MYRYIHRIVGINVYLYKIYFFFIRRKKGVNIHFFDSHTKIYFDGYQRSGNTFLGHILRHIFPDLNMVHHLHKVAPIKIALKKRIPTYILVRDPSEAISSNYLKKFAPSGVIPEELDVKLLSIMVNDYYDYYSFVLNNIDKLNIIYFNNLINDAAEIIFRINNDNSLSEMDNIELSNKTEKAIFSYSGSTTKYGSSKPNASKEREKKVIKVKLAQFKRFKENISIYNEIIS